jgi:hypothetical protein
VSDLVAFLLARYDEDEQRVLSGYPFDTCEAHEDDYEWDSDALMASWHTARCGHRRGESFFGEDCSCGVPQRVLADCESKRRIVALHSPPLGAGPTPWCRECSHDGDVESVWVDVPCPTLRLLALPYASHPDYRPEWSTE